MHLRNFAGRDGIQLMALRRIKFEWPNCRFLASAHLPVLTSERTSDFWVALILLTSTDSTGQRRSVPRAQRRYRSVPREPCRVPCWGTRLRCWLWCWRSQRKSRWYRLSSRSFYYLSSLPIPLLAYFSKERFCDFYQLYNKTKIQFRLEPIDVFLIYLGPYNGCNSFGSLTLKNLRNHLA